MPKNFGLSKNIKDFKFQAAGFKSLPGADVKVFKVIKILKVGTENGN